MHLTPQQILVQKRLELAFLDTLEHHIIDKLTTEIDKQRKKTKILNEFDHDIHELKQFSCDIKSHIFNIMKAIEIGENSFYDDIESQIHHFQQSLKDIEKKVYQMKPCKTKDHLVKILKAHEKDCQTCLTPIENTTFDS